MTTKQKQEFSWDTQTRIGGYGDAKERHEVFICTLNGKTYIQDTKEVFTQKNGWKRTKGNTMPLANFKELQHILSMHEMDDAFGSQSKEVGGKTVIQAPAKAKAEPKATIKGIKTTIEEKLAQNGNFSLLSKDKQKEAINEVAALHAEHGMVSIAISKSNFFILYGVGQMEAEKTLKATKGFSRSAITFFA